MTKETIDSPFVKKTPKSPQRKRKIYFVFALMLLGSLGAAAGVYLKYPELFGGLMSLKNIKSTSDSTKSGSVDTDNPTPKFASDPNAVSEVKVSNGDGQLAQNGPVQCVQTKRNSDTKKTKKKKKLVNKDKLKKKPKQVGLLDPNLPLQEYDLEDFKEMADKIVFVKEKGQKTSKIASHSQIFYNIPRLKALINEGDKSKPEFKVFQRIFKAMDEAKGGSTVYFELADDEKAALKNIWGIVDSLNIMPVNLVSQEGGKKVIIPAFSDSYSKALLDKYSLGEGNCMYRKTIAETISKFLTANKLDFDKPLPDYFFVQTTVRTVGGSDFQLKIGDQEYKLIAIEEPVWYSRYDIILLRSPVNHEVWSYIDQESVKKISTEEIESDSNSQTHGSFFVYQRVFTEDEKKSIRNKFKKAVKKAGKIGLLAKKTKKTAEADKPPQADNVPETTANHQDNIPQDPVPKLQDAPKPPTDQQDNVLKAPEIKPQDVPKAPEIEPKDAPKAPVIKPQPVPNAPTNPPQDNVPKAPITQPEKSANSTTTPQNNSTPGPQNPTPQPVNQATTEPKKDEPAQKPKPTPPPKPPKRASSPANTTSSTNQTDQTKQKTNTPTPSPVPSTPIPATSTPTSTNAATDKATPEPAYESMISAAAKKVSNLFKKNSDNKKKSDWSDMIWLQK